MLNDEQKHHVGPCVCYIGCTKSDPTAQNKEFSITFQSRTLVTCIANTNKVQYRLLSKCQREHCNEHLSYWRPITAGRRRKIIRARHWSIKRSQNSQPEVVWRKSKPLCFCQKAKCGLCTWKCSLYQWSPLYMNNYFHSPLKLITKQACRICRTFCT